jgi:hypothetical protein
MSTNNRLRDIPKTRALTTGFKLFAGLAFFAMTAAFLTGLQSCRPDYVGWHYPPVECTGGQGLIDSLLGAVTFGYKGGVGDHFVYTVFIAASAIALVLAGLMLAFRDADPTSVAEAAQTDEPPVVNPPTHLNFWPVLAVFSLATMVIGLVVNPATFVAGFFALFTCGLMWMLRSWADNATGDADANEQVHERIAFGLEIPLAAGVVIAVVVSSLSRVLLTVDATAAVAIAGVAAAIIFFIGTAVAYFPQVNRNAVSALLVCGALIVIGAGVVSAAQGERDFEEHEGGESHSEEGDGDHDDAGDDVTTTTASDTTTTSGTDSSTTTVAEDGTN